MNSYTKQFYFYLPYYQHIPKKNQKTDIMGQDLIIINAEK